MATFYGALLGLIAVFKEDEEIIFESVSVLDFFGYNIPVYQLKGNYPLLVRMEEIPELIKRKLAVDQDILKDSAGEGVFYISVKYLTLVDLS